MPLTTLANYYIDAVAGSDANNGTSTSTPWKNISKFNSLTIAARTSIFLKCGSTWSGQQLKFSGSGSAGSPIIVNKYGTGNKPILHGHGLTAQATVYLYNQSYIEINNLEITNSPNDADDSIFFVGTWGAGTNPLGADRRGVMVALDNYGTCNHIYLKNLDIHHVKGQLGNSTTTATGYKLQSTSPTIGSGVNVSAHGGFDFWGTSLYINSPDRGADEYISTGNKPAINAIAINAVKNEVAVYPNPFQTGNLTVKLPSMPTYKSINVDLVNSDGKIMFTEKFSNAADAITVAIPKALSKGVYLVNVQINQSSFSQKLIVE